MLVPVAVMLRPRSLCSVLLLCRVGRPLPGAAFIWVPAETSPWLLFGVGEGYGGQPTNGLLVSRRHGLQDPSNHRCRCHAAPTHVQALIIVLYGSPPNADQGWIRWGGGGGPTPKDEMTMTKFGPPVWPIFTTFDC